MYLVEEERSCQYPLSSLYSGESLDDRVIKEDHTAIHGDWGEFEQKLASNSLHHHVTNWRWVGRLHYWPLGDWCLLTKFRPAIPTVEVSKAYRVVSLGTYDRVVIDFRCSSQQKWLSPPVVCDRWIIYILRHQMHPSYEWMRLPRSFLQWYWIISGRN